MREPIYKMPMADAAWGAASSGWPTPIPMIQIKILSFSEKSVHLSVNLPETSLSFEPIRVRSRHTTWIQPGGSIGPLHTGTLGVSRVCLTWSEPSGEYW
jgi:hypothetical protein